jgi:hypothetical protein
MKSQGACFSSGAWISSLTALEPPALGILDRNSLGAWPDRGPLVCPTVLFTIAGDAKT